MEPHAIWMGVKANLENCICTVLECNEDCRLNRLTIICMSQASHESYVSKSMHTASIVAHTLTHMCGIIMFVIAYR